MKRSGTIAFALTLFLVAPALADPSASIDLGAAKAAAQQAITSARQELSGATVQYPLGQGNPDNDFTTPLTDRQWAEFHLWLKAAGAGYSEDDYDLEGAFKAGVTTPTPENLRPFAKPGSPTFSTESRYARYAPDDAGMWDSGGNYIPSAKRRQAMATAAISAQNAEVERQVAELNAKDPGRYTTINAADYPAWKAKWDREHQAGVEVLGGTIHMDILSHQWLMSLAFVLVPTIVVYAFVWLASIFFPSPRPNLVHGIVAFFGSWLATSIVALLIGTVHDVGTAHGEELVAPAAATAVVGLALLWLLPRMRFFAHRGAAVSTAAHAPEPSIFSPPRAQLDEISAPQPDNRQREKVAAQRDDPGLGEPYHSPEPRLTADDYATAIRVLEEQKIKLAQDADNATISMAEMMQQSVLIDRQIRDLDSRGRSERSRTS